MRTLLTPLGALSALALTLSALAPPRARKAGAPTFVLRVKALDELIADGRYLAAKAGKEEQARQFERMMQKRAGGKKGLEGLDTKKPFGLYGKLNLPVETSEAFLLVPIADEKAFLAMLDNLEVKVTKGEDGVYTVEMEGLPAPVIFRFANGYLYGTLKIKGRTNAVLDKAKLPAPDSVLEGEAGELVTMTLNIESVPAKFAFAAKQIDEKIADARENAPPDEKPAGKAIREASLAEMGRQLKAVVHDGSALSLRLNVDRKAGEVSVGLGLSGRPGSKLAKAIAAEGELKSVGAALAGKASAASGYLNLSLPADLHKALGVAFDEFFKKGLTDEPDKDKRDVIAVIRDALRPSVKAGLLDVGLDLRGPSKRGRYAVLFGARLADGEAFEKAIKALVPKVPEPERRHITLDYDKVGDVNIHRVTQDETKIDPKKREVLGDGPVYFAVRSDALLVSVGEGALAALKEAIPEGPRAAHPLRLQAHLGRLAKLFEHVNKKAPEAARKAFTGEDMGVVRLSVEGGRALQLKFSARAQIITFVSLLLSGEDAGER